MAVYYPGNILSTTEKTTSTSAASGMWSMPAHVQKTKSGSWPGITPPAAAADTYFNRTTLLLHGDGTNGANNTVFVDSSTNAFTVTTNGKPYQGTFSPFSQTGWSNYFNGSSDFLSIASNAALDFGSGDFTIEMWVRFPSNTGDTRTFLTKGWGSGAFAPFVFLQTSTGVTFYSSSTGSSWDIASGVTVIGTTSLNTWYHIAVTRSGSNFRIFVDGTQVGSTFTSSATLLSNSSAVTIGSGISGSTTFVNCYISNLRLVKGTALYTSNFTPSTTPLTAVSGTSLLTCQSNSYKDNSTNAFTVTPSGSPSVQPFSPLAPTSAYSTSTVGGSGYFNGSSDYLSIADNTAFDLGASDFTVEAWLYRNTSGAATARVVLNQSNPGASTNSAFYFGAGDDGIALYLSTSGTSWTNNIQTGLALKLNSWHHVVWQRRSNTLEIYLDGVLQTVTSGTAAFSGTINNSSLSVQIGSQNNQGAFFGGYISNLRLVKGTALYTSNFTPPTAPPTAVSGTSLLLNATNAGIIDSTAKNLLTTGSGASISTTQSKFGGSSISFSGSAGGYLQLASSNFNTIPASTDFTLECWVYTTASNRAPNVWHNVSSQKIIAFFLSSSDFNNISTIMGPFSYPASNASVVRGTTDIVANTWTHVAFVRSGSTITVYVNGTACGTGTSSYASLPLQLVGAISTGATTPDFYFFPGYIDDLRLTIGVARYTSNFTPTTTAFENQ